MPTSERALKAAEEVRSLAMNYFGYATATGDTNEVYQKFPVTRVAAIIDAEFPAGDRRKGERREGSSSGADKDYCLADGSYRRKSERRLDHQLSPSPCGVKGHCTKDWTGRRNSERRINNHCCNGGTIHCLELHPSRVGCRRNFPRRITNLGGYCRRCKEINRACAEAELSEAERQGERIEKAVTEALEAAVVRFEFVALEYCERWKVMPKQFIDKGTVAIRGKEEKWRQ